MSAIIEIRLLAARPTRTGWTRRRSSSGASSSCATARCTSPLVDAEVAGKITDAEIRARYDQEVAATPPVNEVQARHILVKTKEEALDVIKQLDGGADFEKLANEKTNDPSGKTTGGDLGWFGPGQMVPEFEKAAFALNAGEYTKEPVQTQFGWHVIKVEDKRDAAAAGLRGGQGPGALDRYVREKYFALVKSIRDGAQGRDHRPGAEGGRRAGRKVAVGMATP